MRPVVRVRREDENYYMTYKGGGMMAREEYNLPLECRFICPSSSESRWQYYYQKTLFDTFHAYTIELDVFEGLFEGIVVAEVEFPSIEEAESFAAPEWFGEDVTYDGRYA